MPKSGLWARRHRRRLLRPRHWNRLGVSADRERSRARRVPLESPPASARHGQLRPRGVVSPGSTGRTDPPELPDHFARHRPSVRTAPGDPAYGLPSGEGQPDGGNHVQLPVTRGHAGQPHRRQGQVWRSRASHLKGCQALVGGNGLGLRTKAALTRGALVKTTGSERTYDLSRSLAAIAASKAS